MFRLLLALILGVATALPAAAQSTAINGSIEGVVSDESGAVLPGGYRAAMRETQPVSGAEAIAVLERIQALKESNGR